MRRKTLWMQEFLMLYRKVSLDAGASFRKHRPIPSASVARWSSGYRIDRHQRAIGVSVSVGKFATA